MVSRKWFRENGKRKAGRPRKSWSDTLSEDLQNIEMPLDYFFTMERLERVDVKQLC